MTSITHCPRNQYLHSRIELVLDGGLEALHLLWLIEPPSAHLQAQFTCLDVSLVRLILATCSDAWCIR